MDIHIHNINDVIINVNNDIDIRCPGVHIKAIAVGMWTPYIAYNCSENNIDSYTSAKVIIQIHYMFITNSNT